MFTQMVDTAKREKTEEADKRKKFRSCRSEQPFKYFSINLKIFFLTIIAAVGSSLTRSGGSTGGASCWVCCTTTTSTSTCTAPDQVILASDWSMLSILASDWSMLSILTSGWSFF